MKPLTFLLTSIATSWAFNQLPDHRLYENHLFIHFAAVDSPYAIQAISILSSAREQMSRDLQMPFNDTLHVLIAPSRSYFRQFIQGTLPSWTQAIALAKSKTMVIKSPRWTPIEEDFAQALTHELLHLVLYERTNNKEIPLWLHEGLAIFYSNDRQWDTKTALSKAVFTRSVIPLSFIDQVLRFDRHRAELAYQESYSAVKYLLATYDIESLNIILDGIKNGHRLDSSFIEATGSSFKEFEAEWLKHIEKTQKWFWLSDFHDLLWIFILVLLLMAGWFVHQRNRKKIATWEREGSEESENPIPSPDPPVQGANSISDRSLPDDPFQENIPQ